MGRSADRTTPIHLWVVAVITLIWNAFWCFDYYTAVSSGQAHAMPSWQVALWAVAVWGGLTGSALLLLRSIFAFWLFGLSLLGSVAVNGYQIFAMTMPGFIKLILIAMISASALQLWYSWVGTKRGWLKPGPVGTSFIPFLTPASKQAGEGSSRRASEEQLSPGPKQGWRSTLAAAAVGATAGSLITASVLLFAAPDNEEIVRETLLRDPEIVVDALEKTRILSTAIQANRSALETPFASSWRGAEKPDVVVVEFFDYACAYCRASNADIDRLLSEDKGLRVIFRELPILGPDSETAARVSLAASSAGRFRQYHDAVFAAGRPSANAIAQGASAAGIQPHGAKDAEAGLEIARNRKLARQLGITGTPSFVVGNRLVKGAVGYDALKDAIAAARRRANMSV